MNNSTSASSLGQPRSDASSRAPRRTLTYPQKAERAYHFGVRSVRAKRKKAVERELYGLSGPELGAACSRIPSPAHGDRWGSWAFDAKRLALTYEPADSPGWWEVDLERMTDPARMLDAIFQFSTKVWAPRRAVGDLVQALDDLLDPQSTLCSWGQSKTLDATKHLEELTANKYVRALSTESSIAGFRLVN
jgi:hypothetical protein